MAETGPAPTPAPDGPPRPALAVGVGIAAGAVSGLLGVAGGAVLVPGLAAALRIGPRRAAASSLVAIIPIAIVGGAVYYLAIGHQVRVDLALALAAGSVVGARFGARLAGRLPESVLRLAFAVLMLVLAAQLVIAAHR